MIDTLLNVFAPHRCCSCGDIGAILCESCKINILEEPFEGCVLCHRPCGKKGACAPCSRVLPCEQIWCVGHRSGALKNLLDAYKFSSSVAAARQLIDLLDRTLPVVPNSVAVMGIPTSSKTRRVRGFDHIGRLVQGLSKRRGLATISLLERASHETLHFLPYKERIKLGPSLFRIASEAVPERILLIDDILTTGTTLQAAVKLLREAGVKHVYVAILARQPEHK